VTTCSLATTFDMVIAVFADDHYAYDNCLGTTEGNTVSNDDDDACLTSQGGMQDLSGAST